jgi:hypothetical protein
MAQNQEIKEPRINISIIGEEAILIEKLQAALQTKLMMKLSTAQVIKRIVRQAAIAEQIS